MRNRHLFIFILILLAAPLTASVITLQNGQTIQGEILVQNNDVIIIKNANGQRFQYPPQEVVSITEEDTPVEQPEQVSTLAMSTNKKTVFFLSLQGGGAFIPNGDNGGYVDGEVMIGSRYIGTRHIFIGGGIGVNGMIMPNKTHIFLPLQVAIKVPLIEGKHAPFIGANLGYGFALSKNCSGGIYSAFEVGYRYQAGRMTTLFASLGVQFQQTKIDVAEVINNDVYQDYAGRNLVTFGAKIGISF